MKVRLVPCGDCQNGEHENYDDDVRLTLVIDPKTGMNVRQCYLCSVHREIYSSNGYALVGY